MATLAENVTATETDWDLSGPLPAGTTHLLVDAELVEVITPAVRFTQRDEPINRCEVRRNAAGTNAAHTSGATLTALTAPPLGAGGSGSLTLAEVLAEGNDTGGLALVSNPAPDADAHVEGTATASGAGTATAGASAESEDGVANANSIASAFGTGDANAKRSATTGVGIADATTTALAGDGDVFAGTSATSVAGSADAAATVNGPLGASANRAIGTVGGDGDAEAVTTLTAGGNGAANALTHLAASGSGDIDGGTLAEGGSGAIDLYLNATTVTGTASVQAIAKYTDGEFAGMSAVADVTSARMGFNGVTPIQRPSIGGSRAGNAALAELLTALHDLGLITDSSEA